MLGGKTKGWELSHMSVMTRVDIAEVVERQDGKRFLFATFLMCALVMLADGFDNQAINYGIAF